MLRSWRSCDIVVESHGQSYWIKHRIPSFLSCCPAFCVLGIKGQRRNSKSLTLNIIYCRWNTDQHFSLTQSAPAGSELKVFTVSCQDASVPSVSLSFSHIHTKTWAHSFIKSFTQPVSHSARWKCDNLSRKQSVKQCGGLVKSERKHKRKTDPQMYNTVKYSFLWAQTKTMKC